jgi:hypothetical protein
VVKPNWNLVYNKKEPNTLAMADVKNKLIQFLIGLPVPQSHKQTLLTDVATMSMLGDGVVYMMLKQQAVSYNSQGQSVESFENLVSGFQKRYNYVLKEEQNKTLNRYYNYFTKIYGKKQ